MYNSFTVKHKVLVVSLLAVIIATFSTLSPRASFASPSDINISDTSSNTKTLQENQQFKSPDGLRAITQTGKYGLQLKIVEGDRIKIENNQAIWNDKDGNTIAHLTLTPFTEGNNLRFAYDPINHRIAPLDLLLSLTEKSNKPCLGAKGSFYWSIAWGTLVCAPLGIGLGAVTAGVGFAAGAACNAAGAGLNWLGAC